MAATWVDRSLSSRDDAVKYKDLQAAVRIIPDTQHGGGGAGVFEKIDYKSIK
jgi:hypothetical protein